jgi:hypothetical protein
MNGWMDGKAILKMAYNNQQERLKSVSGIAVQVFW